MRSLVQFFRRFRYGPPVVVVSGLPRSGTSMLMKMLEEGGLPVWSDGIRAADGQNPKGYYELERIKELDKGGDRHWVREGRGRAVKVISSLLEHLPEDNNYRVLFIRRPMDEVLASQAAMLAERGEAGGDLDDAAMTRVFETHLRKVKSFLARRPAFEVLDVDYHDVLIDARRQARRIHAFLGGSLDVEKMAAVVDRQLYRNRSSASRA
jgi:hypothetical protein